MTEEVVAGRGPNIRSILTMVRRAKGLKLADTREVGRSGGEDGLWRVTLEGGLVVECTVIQHSTTSLYV